MDLILFCTPKALVNWSPGLFQPWVLANTKINTESVRLRLELLQSSRVWFMLNPGVEATPGSN